MRVIYNKLSREIVTTVEDDDSITSFPSDLGVIQGDAEMIANVACSIGLDVSQIPNLNMTPERLKVLQRMKRCNDVKLRFLEENASVTIAPSESATMLQAFMNVLLLLDVGDAKTALTNVEAMQANLFVLTPTYSTDIERKQSYIDELTQIVADLFEV